MERLRKPSTIAALTWLKDRWVSMKVPQSRVMVEKAIVHRDGTITFVFYNGTEIAVESNVA